MPFNAHIHRIDVNEKKENHGFDGSHAFLVNKVRKSSIDVLLEAKLVFHYHTSVA